MGSSYTKQEISLGRALPIYNDRPWEFAECLYEQFVQLECQTLDLERELMILKKRSPQIKTRPHKQDKETEPKPQMADASCQTGDQFAMEIETQPRRLIKCTSFRKNTFYTKVYTKKHVKKEKMEVEIEKKRRRTTSQTKIPKKGLKFVKIYVPKEVMEIESKKQEIQVCKTPPRRVSKKVKVKTKHGETPEELARNKKRKKKNTPRKALDDSELKAPSANLNLIQPTKVRLITDFFKTVEKSSFLKSIKLAPDPT